MCMLSRAIFWLSWRFVAVRYVNFICTNKNGCGKSYLLDYLCVQYWSAVVYKAEVVVKLAELSYSPEKIASVKTRMFSTRIFSTETPSTAKQQASQTLHQDKTTASLWEASR